MGLFSFLYERVFHIQLYGGINHRMTENLLKALKWKGLYSVQLIAVSINSHGGSLTQAKNINFILKNLSRKTGAPIYTFAEDSCLNTANTILTAGNRCFANEFSLVGDFAFSLQSYGVKGFLNEYGINAVTNAAGSKKAKLNMFEDLKDEDKKWMQNLLYETEYELKAEILNQRGNTFHHLNLTNESIEEKVFQPAVLTAADALKYGVIDGVTTLERVLHERYPDVKVAEIMKRGGNQGVRNSELSNSVSAMFQLK